MNLSTEKTRFSQGEHATLLAAAQTALAEGMTQADMARQAEIAPATLNQYLKGKYPGDSDSVAAKLHKWNEARKKARAMQSRLPKAPVYQPLSGSQQIMARLHYARQAGRMVSICGAPGVSKTSTAVQYRHETPRVWLATMDPSTRGVNTCLVEILAAMGEPDAKGTPQALARRVLQRAAEADCLIIVDEAQHMSDQAVEQLRAINDKARAQGVRVGIALLGNQVAFNLVAHDGSRPAFAQVSSRMAQRLWIVGPEAADVERLAVAWAEANGEQMTAEAAAYAAEIASRPGGLRNVEMAMEAALIAAWGAGQRFDAGHLRWAFARLSGQ